MATVSRRDNVETPLPVKIHERAAGIKSRYGTGEMADRPGWRIVQGCVRIRGPMVEKPPRSGGLSRAVYEHGGEPLGAEGFSAVSTWGDTKIDRSATKSARRFYLG